MKNLSLYCLTICLACLLFSCQNGKNTNQTSGQLAYYDEKDSSRILSGGVKMIPIQTPKGNFKVWTKKVGNHPAIKVLLLHGGPGGTHEAFECFDSFFPKKGFEYYYYDQLGSYRSDQPKDSSLWTTERFVEEVEQVRQALGLNKDNFYLLGHSWGGILAMEYALKYQQHLKGLIISNMMASCPDYGKYAQEVLAKQMNPEVLREIRKIEAAGDYANPRYMELLLPNFYAKHVIRLKEWPEPLNRMFKHLNPEVYVLMQGPSEFGIAGRLAKWDRKADLPKISVPVLTIGGKYDTMDPEHMKWMATQVQKGSHLFCPKGTHCSFYDDQPTYFKGLIDFILKVEEEGKNKK